VCFHDAAAHHLLNTEKVTVPLHFITFFQKLSGLA
jgi:hypothetical protein